MSSTIALSPKFQAFVVADGETPPPADKRIFREGRSVAQICQYAGMRSWHIEALVRYVADATKTKTDWHYSGGVAQILTLGDPKLVVDALVAAWEEFSAPFVEGSRIAFGLPARVRAGVDWPSGATGVG